MEVIVINNKHIQVNDYQPKNPDEYSAFWQNIKKDYKGCKIDFCFHNCEVPLDFMKAINAGILEACIETRLFPPGFDIENEPTTIITKDNFKLFSKIHDDVNPDMYWTSKKIKQDMSCWFINVYGNSYVLMSLWGRCR